ncbi:hypothetical protein KIF59_05645 [Enterobacter cloacae subsp. cloacae]|nr:hypothetical protein [Enterobacter cloacae subsp. cloacae]
MTFGIMAAVMGLFTRWPRWIARRQSWGADCPRHGGPSSAFLLAYGFIFLRLAAALAVKSATH